MSGLSERILRGKDAQVSGQFRLEVSQGRSARDKAAAGIEKKAASRPAEARIIEKNPQFALIEVVCGCGSKIRLKCEYGQDG